MWIDIIIAIELAMLIFINFSIAIRIRDYVS